MNVLAEIGKARLIILKETGSVKPDLNILAECVDNMQALTGKKLILEKDSTIEVAEKLGGVELYGSE